MDYIAEANDELVAYEVEDSAFGIWLDEAPFKNEVVWHAEKDLRIGNNVYDCMIPYERTPGGFLACGHGMKPAVMIDCHNKTMEMLNQLGY